MKKLLLFLTTILTINCYSQISFEKGYYVDNSGQKKECLIKNDEWVNNPSDFKYKVAENDEVKTIGIDAVKEFGIYNVSKYIRATVQADLSSQNKDYLVKDKNLELTEKELFLKVLIEGKGNLYVYDSGDLVYFYNVDGSIIQQLIFKTYLYSDNKTATNNDFRRQLWENLKCSTIEMNELIKLDYKKDNLVDFFIQYNECTSSNFTNYGKKQKRDLFNLNLRPRLNNSSLVLHNMEANFLVDDFGKNIDFGSKTSFGFGIEAEFILPVNKNKWALLIEPTYQSYKGEQSTKYNFIAASSLKLDVKYNSIEVPLGVRHYLFLNKNSKIFLNASIVFDFKFNSSIQFIKSDGSVFNTLDINNCYNFAFGVGYKLYDKFSLETRFFTNRDFLITNHTWSSDYKVISIVFGYTLF